MGTKQGSDPFERAKAIRAGELDHEMPPYEELTGWLERVPKTWLPSLLMRCTEICTVQGVFKEGAAAKVVEATERKTREAGGGFLRKM